MVHWTELLLRLLIASLLGALIGFERERRARDLGFRTHILGALAAATFTVVSLHFMYFQNYDEQQGGGGLVEVDASRIAAAVVVGVGFLAGGTILRVGTSLRGLTTAAGMWLVSAIGMAAGSGMYKIAVGATALGLFVLTVLRWLRGEAPREARLHVRVDDLRHVVTVTQALEGVVTRLRQVGYTGRRDDRDAIEVIFDVEHAQVTSLEKLVALVDAVPGARCVRVATPELEV